MRQREFRDWSRGYQGSGQRNWHDRLEDERNERELGQDDPENWDQRYRRGEYERYGSDSDYGRDRDPRRGSYPEIERGSDYGYGPYGERGRSGERGPAQPRDFGYGNRFAGRDDPRDERGGGQGYRYGGGMSLDDGRFVTRPSYDYDRPRRTGNAPKGYKRSDDRIREDVCDRLSERWDVDSQGIEVSVSSGEVTLSGSVPERGMKFRAESISDGVTGVLDVHNQLRVVAPGGRGQEASPAERDDHDDRQDKGRG